MFLCCFLVHFGFLCLTSQVSGGLLDWFHRGTEPTTVAASTEATRNPLHILEVSTAPYPEYKDCVDISKNCSEYVNTLCKDKQYAPLMAKICPLTCHACCWDKSQRCEEWKERGFCDREFYQTAAKMTCPATCGHCN